MSPDSFENTHQLFSAASDVETKLEYLFDAVAIINKKIDDEKEAIKTRCDLRASDCAKLFDSIKARSNKKKVYDKMAAIITSAIVTLATLFGWSKT